MAASYARHIDAGNLEHARGLFLEAGGTEAEFAWELVQRWPGMSGADKLAWFYLWKRSRDGREVFDCTPTDVAAAQATSSDAGRQRIKNLANKWNLIIVWRTVNSVRTIEVPNPFDVAIANGVKCDGQFLLPFMDDESSPHSERAPLGASRSSGDESDMDVTAAGPGAMALRVARPAAEEPPEDPRAHQNRTEEPRPNAEELPEAPGFETEDPRFHRGSSGGTSFSPRNLAEEPRSPPAQDACARARPHAGASLSDPSERSTSLPSVPSELPSPFGNVRGGAGGDSGPPPDDRGSSGGTSATIAELQARIAELEARQSGAGAVAEQLKALESEAQDDELAEACNQRWPRTEAEVPKVLREALIMKIKRKVGCARLKAIVCVKAANAELMGKISEHEHHTLLETVERKRRNRELRHPPSCYYVQSLKRMGVLNDDSAPPPESKRPPK